MEVEKREGGELDLEYALRADLANTMPGLKIGNKMDLEVFIKIVNTVLPNDTCVLSRTGPEDWVPCHMDDEMPHVRANQVKFNVEHKCQLKYPYHTETMPEWCIKSEKYHYLLCTVRCQTIDSHLCVDLRNQPFDSVLQRSRSAKEHAYIYKKTLERILSRVFEPHTIQTQLIMPDSN